MSTLQRIILDRAILSRNLQVTSTIFSWYLLQQTLFPNVSYKCIVFQALQYTLLRTISTYKYYYLSMYPKNIECTLYVIYLLRWFKTLWSYLIAFFMQFMRLYKLLSHVPFQKKEQKVFSRAVPTIILLSIERICLGLELKTLLLLECDSHSFIHWDC